MNIKDYASLTKPKIALLNLFTGLTAYILAGGGPAGLFHLSISGYLAVGGAGVVNHYLDTDIDSKMVRTAKRPLPSGRVKLRNALIFGSVLIIFSGMYAFFSLNLITALFILLGVFIYIFIYTLLLKRRSVWNVVIGGAAGSCSPLAGWAAAGGEFTLVPMVLAALVFLWTPGHFWALAIRAARDYAAAGVPMLPAVKGMRFATTATLVSNLLAIAWALVLIPFLSNIALYLALMLPFSVWLLYENVEAVLYSSEKHSWKAFKVSSPWLAVVFFAALLAWR